LNQLDASGVDGFTVEFGGEAELGCREVESVRLLNAFLDQIREGMAAATTNF